MQGKQGRVALLCEHIVVDPVVIPFTVSDALRNMKISACKTEKWLFRR